MREVHVSAVVHADAIALWVDKMSK